MFSLSIMGVITIFDSQVSCLSSIADLQRKCISESVGFSQETNKYLLYLTLEKLGPSLAQKVVSKCKLWSIACHIHCRPWPNKTYQPKKPFHTTLTNPKTSLQTTKSPLTLKPFHQSGRMLMWRLPTKKVNTLTLPTTGPYPVPVFFVKP